MSSSSFQAELFDPGRWSMGFVHPASDEAGLWPDAGSFTVPHIHRAASQGFQSLTCGLKNSQTFPIKWNAILSKLRSFPHYYIQHMDADKASCEKVRRELHKNAKRFFEQILEATSHKTAAVWPSTSHLWSHSNQANKTCRTLLDELISIFLLWTPSHERPSVGRPTRTYLQ